MDGLVACFDDSILYFLFVLSALTRSLLPVLSGPILPASLLLGNKPNHQEVQTSSEVHDSENYYFRDVLPEFGSEVSPN